MTVFPANVWDKSTLSRLQPAVDHQWPTPSDFDEIANQIQDIQNFLLNLPVLAANVDGPVKYFNEYLTIVTKDIVVAIGAIAVANVDVGYDIPASSLVIGAAMNIETAITLATATKIGLGVAGSLAKYGTITGGTKNNKSTLSITPTALASAEDLKIYATDNASAAAGTIQNGTMRVRLTLLTQAALPNAA